MTDDVRPDTNDLTSLQRLDPWAALQDGRRQLLAALDACDPRAGARTLTIPEFANLGEATGTLTGLLLAHAARDREHAVFFAALDTPDGIIDSTQTTAELTDDWSAVRVEVEAARLAMLERAAEIGSEHWERPLQPPWEDGGQDYLISLLVVRAMCDGLLADAISALRAPTDR